MIVSREHLDAACHLLHRVYCQEQGWLPPSGNPSGQQVQVLSSGVHGLVDDYDRHAKWVGLFDQHELVGCLRLAGRRQCDRRLELENYFELPAELAAGTVLAEVNRLAIDPRVRGREGAIMLHLSLLKIVEQTGESVVIAAQPGTGRLAVEYLGMVDTGLSFRYHARDPEPAHVYLLVNRGANVARQQRTLEAALKTRPA